MRRLILGLVLLLPLLIAAKASSGLTLTGGTYPWWNGRYIDAAGQPCIGEDDLFSAQFTGSLAPGESKSITANLCWAYQSDGVTPYPTSGGIMLVDQVFLVSGKPSLVATTTAPDGTRYTHGDGWVCAVGGPVSLSTGFGGAPLDPGGRWTITLANVGSHVARGVDWRPAAWMDYSLFQYSMCPAADRHIVP